MTTLTQPRGVAGSGRSRPSAFRELSWTNWRELAREPKTLFFTMIFPFIFLAMFSGIGVLMDQGGEAPVVTVAAGSPAVVQSLEEHGVAVVGPGLAGGDSRPANVTVRVDGDRAIVILGEGPMISKDAVVSAVSETGIGKSEIAVVNADGSPVFDPLRGSLPTVLMLGLLSLAFLGTAAPLVGLRQRGTLRLLGTTPVRRSTFILAQSPGRFFLGGVQVALIAGYAYFLGYLDLGQLAGLLTTCLIGLVMVLSIGYLFASRMVSQDLATTIASLAIPVAMIFAGSMMPTELLPEGVQQVTQYLPTTILSEAIGISLVGDGSSTDLPLMWALMAGIAVVCTLLAARLFTWDQGEKR